MTAKRILLGIACCYGVYFLIGGAYYLIKGMPPVWNVGPIFRLFGLYLIGMVVFHFARARWQ